MVGVTTMGIDFTVSMRGEGLAFFFNSYFIFFAGTVAINQYCLFTGSRKYTVCLVFYYSTKFVHSELGFHAEKQSKRKASWI